MLYCFFSGFWRTWGDEHKEKVIEDILDNWVTLSQNGKFHAVFATSSIPEAIEYYRLIKRVKPELRITALFDPNIDNGGNMAYKGDGIVEILEDYNQNYNQNFNRAAHSKFKKDIAARLAHKKPYFMIDRTPEMQIDLLIVVDQMLTGFDSKWINSLYMDKVIKHENIIQAFSRTNRLFGTDKPFGTIRYYKMPHTMEQHINTAVKLYSGDKQIGLFADKLERNINKMNSIYDDIFELFNNAGIPDFTKLPDDLSERGQFAKLFKELNSYLQAAKIQGFTWSQLSYTSGKGKEKSVIELKFDENTYLILALRYKELLNDGSVISSGDVPFEIEGYLTEIDTGVIDADYMNSRFTKYLKTLQQEGVDPEQKQKTLDELHKSFAFLTQEEQKYAKIFLNDVQRGDVEIDTEKTFIEYVTEYQSKAKNAEIYKIAQIFGLDEAKLRSFINTTITESNINEYGRFDELKRTVDKAKAKIYFEKPEGKAIPAFKINIRVHNLLQKFIISGGFELE
ncbi:MAG: hypothetical protein GY730_01355 [bacterium]|nr:hypothetical protein [bacterium]